MRQGLPLRRRRRRPTHLPHARVLRPTVAVARSPGPCSARGCCRPLRSTVAPTALHRRRPVARVDQACLWLCRTTTARDPAHASGAIQNSRCGARQPRRRVPRSRRSAGAGWRRPVPALDRRVKRREAASTAQPCRRAHGWRARGLRADRCRCCPHAERPRPGSRSSGRRRARPHRCERAPRPLARAPCAWSPRCAERATVRRCRRRAVPIAWRSAVRNSPARWPRSF